MNPLVAGFSRKCPACSSSRRPSTGGLSKRGRHNQSTDPAAVTNAPVPQSDNNACSPSGTSLTRPHIPTITVAGNDGTREDDTWRAVDGSDDGVSVMIALSDVVPAVPRPVPDVGGAPRARAPHRR